MANADSDAGCQHFKALATFDAGYKTGDATDETDAAVTIYAGFPATAQSIRA